MAKKKTTSKSNSKPKKNKLKTSSGFKKYKRLLWLLVLSPLIGLTGLLLIASFSDLPKIEDLANPETQLATQIFSSDGEVLGKFYKQNRTDLSYQEVPDDIINALVATEDERYYGHSGVDFYSTARAVILMGKRGGGSTITQQLAQMQFTDRSKSFIKRVYEKAKEYIISSKLEKTYTKKELLALYFNQYDFLNQAVGLKSASNIYFNKDVSKLELHESAMLVGMLKNSALFNPIRKPDTVLHRRNVVFGQMMRNEFLTQQEFDSLKVLPLGVNFQKSSHDEGSAQYFREELRKKVTKIINEEDEDGKLLRTKPDGSKYDVYSDGLRIYTTIDSRMQEYAEWAVKEHLSTHLQAQFSKELSWLKKENYPFFNGIKKDKRELLMNQAMKESPRWRVMHGKECPSCRNSSHVKSENIEGIDSYKCHAYGCGTHWKKPTEAEMEKQWNTPTTCSIYTPQGIVDSIMTPLDSVKHHLAALNSGVVAMNPNNGHIKAWVGGVNYKYFKYDHAGQAKRQVGSTFKPFVYANALRNGMHPCEELIDQVYRVPTGPGQEDWAPENSEGSSGEMVSLRYGLAHSMNTISAYQIKKYGHKPVIDLAYKMGIKNEIPEVPSIGLGVAELTVKEITSALSTFANQGVYIEPIFITHIEDKNGNIIYESDQETYQAIDPKTAYLMLDMMKDVITKGTSVRLTYGRPYGNINFPVAGKTGTTQDNGDGWFVGLTPDLVTGVWVGASNRAIRFRSTTYGQGANTGLPIFGYFINNDKK